MTVAIPATASELKSRKGKERIVMITAYDAPGARIAAAAGVDMILVGDSAANVVLGLDSTRDVGMSEMLLFTGAARRGAPGVHVVADMPFGSDDDVEHAVTNALAFRAAGADSVKVEGFKPAAIEKIFSAGVPVVAHLGLLPQTAMSLKQVGRDPEEAEDILRQAKVLESAGAFAIVLEHVPDALAARAQSALGIPVIGIGAGEHVDGQVLVFHDALGLHPFRMPPFAEKYVDGWSELVGALVRYRDSTRSGRAPGRTS